MTRSIALLGCAAALALTACEPKPVTPAAPAPKILETISAKAMTALLKTQNYTVDELQGDVKTPTLAVSWPDRALGNFEIQLSDCKPATVIDDAECALMSYIATNDQISLTTDQVNLINSNLTMGSAFVLQAEGLRLKKGTLVFTFPLPLYGGVTEAHVKDSIGGWGNVLQNFINGVKLQARGENAPAPAPATP